MRNFKTQVSLKCKPFCRSIITYIYLLTSLREPFLIKDPKKIRLVARYLIEDNDEYFVYFNPTKR